MGLSSGISCGGGARESFGVGKEGVVRDSIKDVKFWVVVARATLVERQEYNAG